MTERKKSPSGREHVGVGDRVRSVYAGGVDEGVIVQLAADEGLARVRWASGLSWVSLNAIERVK
jgi:hypothetical protein